jgi:tetratricopeptide (TPR) repeat protein
MRSRQQPDNLVLVKETVLMLVERARLTGLPADYRLATDLLARAAPSVATAAQLCQAQAKLHFAMHRLQAASAALAACAGSMDSAEAAALAADIAFYSGQYPLAQRIYQGLLNQDASSSQFIRMAIYRWKTGALVEAGALLEAAKRRYHGGEASTRAWFKLQRGLIAWERGRLDEALALYRLADDAMPGWWRVDAQIAEVRRLQGDVAGARVLMERLAARGERPELMDELTRLLREGQTPDAAQPWIKRAQAIHHARLAAFSVAAAGHAAEHFLQFGAPAQALALARRDVALRPFGDAQITMAAALFRAGQAGEAANWIRRVSESGWNSARLHAVAAQIYAALGQNTQADAERAQALAMNPYAMRLYPIAQPVQPELVSMW